MRHTLYLCCGRTVPDDAHPMHNIGQCRMCYFHAKWKAQADADEAALERRLRLLRSPLFRFGRWLRALAAKLYGQALAWYRHLNDLDEE